MSLPGITQGAIAQLERLTKYGELQAAKIPAVYRDELEACGLLERVPRGPVRFNVRVTEKGRAFVGAIT